MFNTGWETLVRHGRTAIRSAKLAAIGVTTVIPPLTSRVLPKIVSWQPFYDSLGPDCDPSYALRGGGSPIGCSDDAQLEESAASTFLTQGDTVVMTDYEETNEAYGAGRLEGYATLDGIRAAETYLRDIPASTPVGMVGYSGGAIASQWAAELAPAYAPHIDLVGTAAGGVFVDPFHSLSFINGNATGWSDVIPVYLILLQRAFGVPVASYLSALGVKIYQADENTSISDFATGFTTFQQLVKPQYGDVSKVRPFVKALDQLIMGSDGTPKSPMFLGNGEGTKNNGWDGDGIMITDDVEGLAHEYCSRGVPVEFQVYNGLPHVEAFAPFISYAIPYLTDRLNGLPAPSNCASIGTGNSLAPQPIPAAPRRAHGHKHSGTGTSATNASAATAGTHGTADIGCASRSTFRISGTSRIPGRSPESQSRQSRPAGTDSLSGTMWSTTSTRGGVSRSAIRGSC